MPSSTTPYQVSANRTDIDKFPQFASLAWQVVYTPKPNVVCLKFADKAEAGALAESMRAEGIKTFTNWLA